MDSECARALTVDPYGVVRTIYCRRSDGAPEYYGDPDRTASIKLFDGRFTVGDLGWLDDDGFLYPPTGASTSF